MKIRLGVLFGGRSVEHEISIISAVQAIHSLDPDKYDVVPVYVTKDNQFYTGSQIANIEAYRDIPKLLRQSQRVIPVRDGNQIALVRYPVRTFRPVAGYIDVALPVVHGTNVEDGTLQGYLKMLNLPFAGCDVTSSAVGMDKAVMKSVLKDHGIPVLDCCLLTGRAFAENEQNVLQTVETKFAFPVIVKPVNLGSSVGISVARNREQLRESLDTAFTYAPRVLVEPAIQNLREINCAVLGNLYQAEASECEEPLNGRDILSYEDKYMSGGKNSKNASGGSKGMASLTRRIPAGISPERREEIRTLAVKAFQILNCNGVARIDFMIDGDTGKVYLNEINTIPGSLSFYLWEPLGISYPELLDRIIQLALERKREDEDIVYSFDTNVLSGVNLGGAKGAKGK